MVDSIIFDLDGTMWDSSDGVTKAWNEAVREAGYDFTIEKEAIDKIMGLPVQQNIVLQLAVILKRDEAPVHSNQTIVCVLVNGKFVTAWIGKILRQQRTGLYCSQLPKVSTFYLICHLTRHQ